MQKLNNLSSLFVCLFIINFLRITHVFQLMVILLQFVNGYTKRNVQLINRWKTGNKIQVVL